MSKLGGHLLVDCLVSLGARQAFGVPGESYLAVLDGFYERGNSTDFMICRQEGGAAYMASAYGKLTGEPGLCFVTRGPGATNASVGIHTAMQDSSPMIVFIGQVGMDMREREAFQEIDYRAMFGKVAKWVTEIEDPNRIPEIVSRAWTVALSGRQGPVVVALPENVLSAMVDVPACKPVRIPQAAPQACDIAELEDLLKNAKRPLIMAGGGGWDTAGKAALAAFAKNNNLPVVAAMRYHDVHDNHDAQYVGDCGVGMHPYMKDLVKNTDLLIAIGIRFGESTTDGYELLTAPNPSQKIVHVHASSDEIGKIYAADLPIQASPNAFCDMAQALKVKGDWAAYREQARADYEASFTLPEQPGTVDMGAIMAHLQAVLPEDAIITSGAGNFSIWNNKLFSYGAKQRLLAPQSGSMGYGLPAAIAAKKVHPERTVVCLAGDGDFQMNGQELGSAMQSNCQPITLIINNGTYGTIRMHQERTYPERVSGTDIVNPDFVMLAQAYGCHAERVSHTAEFADAFERARQSSTGAVLEIMIDQDAVTPKQRLSQMRAIALGKG